MEFDIAKAAQERARNMVNIYEKYDDTGQILTLVNRNKLSDILSRKVNELHTLQAWEKLRFIVAYNKSGQLGQLLAGVSGSHLFILSNMTP